MRGGTAYRFFEDLYRAVRARMTVIIDGRTVDVGELIRESEDISGLTGSGTPPLRTRRVILQKKAPDRY